MKLYDSLTNQQKSLFSDIANKLLAYNFLSKDKKDNRDNYYFVLSFKDVFSEFFSLLNKSLIIDKEHGCIMLKSYDHTSLLSLKKDETIVLLILRLLYNELLKELSLVENPIINYSDILDKYEMLDIKKKLNKTDLINIIRLFRRYNLVDSNGDLKNFNTKIIILPTILLAVSVEDINSIIVTISNINMGAKE